MAFSTFKPIFLVTDILLFLLVLSAVGFVLYARTREYYRTAWRQIRSRRLAMVCMGLVLLYAAAALLDSVHIRQRAYASDGVPQVTDDGRPVYRTEILSLLDLICSDLRGRTEKTFSAPFATHQFTKELIEREDGTRMRGFPPLKYGGSHLQNPAERTQDIAGLTLKGFLIGLGICIALIGLTAAASAGIERLGRPTPNPSAPQDRKALSPSVRTGLRIGAFLGAVALVASAVAVLSAKYHILGTDQVGRDVLFRALKGCRVGLVVGTLTTLIATPATPALNQSRR